MKPLSNDELKRSRQSIRDLDTRKFTVEELAKVLKEHMGYLDDEVAKELAAKLKAAETKTE